MAFDEFVINLIFIFQGIQHQHINKVFWKSLKNINKILNENLKKNNQRIYSPPDYRNQYIPIIITFASYFLKSEQKIKKID